jgi:predicted nucleotide-binding protein (sugar kinase/HSP70/actin superfamily)
MGVIPKRFDMLKKGMGNFNVEGTTLIIPAMNDLSSHLLAAIFESYGIVTQVPETYAGLELGKKHTSGKECFPCMVTLGDILLALQQEKERLGDSFNSENYTIFLPGADGPCRYGMYPKFQRIILDSIPEFEDARFATLLSQSGYSIGAIIGEARAYDFRKMGYTALVAGDLLERLLWRIRPYEKSVGQADAYIEESHKKLIEVFRLHAASMDFDPIYNTLRMIFNDARDIIEPSIPPKPLIGIVGEIYVRSHTESNQHIVKMLETHGAEVVNASIGEWVNYISYEKMIRAKRNAKFHFGRFDFEDCRKSLKQFFNFGVDILYQKFRQRSLYKLACDQLAVCGDHDISALNKKITESNLMGFHIAAETWLSIAGAIMYHDQGFDGVVNIYPFTCMPSTVTSSILKPWCNENKFPFMEAQYDGSHQAGREAIIRTFMYQARQHFERNGKRRKHLS